MLSSTRSYTNGDLPGGVVSFARTVIELQQPAGTKEGELHYRNPIIPGFYPDPSICRVGEDYYLACSSFEFFPGVPIFHSKDLVNWKQIGYCLTRNSQLKLENVPASWGIWAPTIRYHDGRFYMITTNVADRGHFYVYTDDPAGEWSDPVWPGVKTHDPDLFWDDDGKVYLHAHNADNGITQWELDSETGAAMTAGKVVWRGYEDRWCEAPHMYKIGGRYYILAAEGGTWKGHIITIARSDSPAGPFEGCPHNPIATHRHLVMPRCRRSGMATSFRRTMARGGLCFWRFARYSIAITSGGKHSSRRWSGRMTAGR